MLTLCFFFFFATLRFSYGLAVSKAHLAHSKTVALQPEDGIGLALTKMALAQAELEPEDARKSLSREGHKETLVHELRELGTVDDIPILTVETRIASDQYEFAGAHGAAAINLGINQTWLRKGKTKSLMLQQYLDSHMDTPDKLVIMVDGGDVVWGGCDGDVLRSTYETTVNASGGAPIVLSAEFGVWPNTLHQRFQKKVNGREPYASRRSAVLEALGHPVTRRSWDNRWQEKLDKKLNLDPNRTRKFLKPSFEYIDDMYADRTVCNMYGTMCSEPPRYQTPNYGFVMGPVSELKPMVDDIIALLDRDPQAVDQGMTVWWYMHKPEKVTLDFSSTLMLNLHHFFGDKQGFIPDFLTFDKEKKKVLNSVTGKQQCFLHGNGLAKPVIQAIAVESQKLWGRV